MLDAIFLGFFYSLGGIAALSLSYLVYQFVAGVVLGAEEEERKEL